MAGAPCPPELMTRVIEEMHCKDILIGYGETEASPLTHLTLADDSFERRIHTVGKNLPHQEVKIINTDTGKTVDLGEVGEICFRGYHIMKEYYQSPEVTAKAIDQNGWLFSGDLGTMDADGYVKVTGRLKEMIIVAVKIFTQQKLKTLFSTTQKFSKLRYLAYQMTFMAKKLWAGFYPTQMKPLPKKKYAATAKKHWLTSKSLNTCGLLTAFQ